MQCNPLKAARDQFVIKQVRIIVFHIIWEAEDFCPAPDLKMPVNGVGFNRAPWQCEKSLSCSPTRVVVKSTHRSVPLMLSGKDAHENESYGHDKDRTDKSVQRKNPSTRRKTAE